jgi:hypothetical protein
MTIAHPYGGVPLTGADALDHVKANALADGLVRAPDAVNGGTYALSGAADLEFVGGTKKVRFDKLELEGTTKVLLESRSITRAVPDFGMPDDIAAAANWTWTTNPPCWATSGNGAFYLAFPLPLPDGCTLTAVQATVDPQNTGGALPGAGGGPALYVGSYDHTTGTAADITAALPGVADPQENTSIAAYEARHTITASGLSTVIDRTTKRYFALVRGATAGGARTVRVIGIRVTFTTTAMDDGAA